jgi:hypothetical protein
LFAEPQLVTFLAQLSQLRFEGIYVGLSLFVRFPVNFAKLLKESLCFEGASPAGLQQAPGCAQLG